MNSGLHKQCVIFIEQKRSMLGAGIFDYDAHDAFDQFLEYDFARYRLGDLHDGREIKLLRVNPGRSPDFNARQNSARALREHVRLAGRSTIEI